MITPALQRMKSLSVTRSATRGNKRLNKRCVPSGVLQEHENLAGNQNLTTSPFITAMIFIKPNIVNSDKAI